MSKLLNNMRYLKHQLRENSRKLSIDISTYSMLDTDMLKEAAWTRYLLDRLLLSENELERKWSQCCVHSYATDAVAFRGTEDECIEYINREENVNVPLEMYWCMPDEIHYSWEKYFEHVESVTGYRVI